MEQTVLLMCKGSYTELGKSDRRAMPTNGLEIAIQNLAGQQA